MLYIANPVTFDGVNDHLDRGGALTGVSDSKLFTASCWFKTSFVATSQRLVWGGGSTPKVVLSIFGTSNTINLILRNSAANTIICDITSTVTYTTGAWNHAILSVDLANTSNRHIYINGVGGLSAATYTDDIVDFDGAAEWRISANSSLAQKVDGDLADLWVAPGVYIDLSVQANREKFVIANTPFDLGADGSSPTGSAPAIFLAGATSTWQTNLGTGGGFTENGALADGAVPLPIRKVMLTSPA